MPEPGYNPFKNSKDTLTALAKQAEQQAAAAPVLDTEEKTKPFPAMKAARELPVEEEIIEGEPIEDGAPTMPGFQSHSEVTQEQFQQVQDRISVPAKRLSEIDLRNPKSVEEGTRDVLSTLLADDVARQEFEEYLALLIPGTDMDKIRAMETHMQPKVQRAARAHGNPQSVEELRVELHKFFVAKKKEQP